MRAQRRRHTQNSLCEVPKIGSRQPKPCFLSSLTTKGNSAQPNVIAVNHTMHTHILWRESYVLCVRRESEGRGCKRRGLTKDVASGISASLFVCLSPPSITPKNCSHQHSSKYFPCHFYSLFFSSAKPYLCHYAELPDNLITTDI